MSLKNIKWSNFHSPWNNQKTVGFLMISGEEGGEGGRGDKLINLIKSA